jgi:hypothetical protein
MLTFASPMTDLLTFATTLLLSPVAATLSVVNHSVATRSSGEPNWILILALGAIAGTVVDKYGGVLLYPIRQLRDDRYLGEWWEYHLSYRQGQRTLRRSKLIIRRGLHTRVRRAEFWHIPATARSDDQKEIAYRGTLHIENNHLVIQLYATTHDEYLVYRFFNRIPTNAEVIPGIWMSYDHDTNPAAGAAILTNKPMEPDDAEREILRHATSGAIRIK